MSDYVIELLRMRIFMYFNSENSLLYFNWAKCLVLNYTKSALGGFGVIDTPLYSSPTENSGPMRAMARMHERRSVPYMLRKKFDASFAKSSGLFSNGEFLPYPRSSLV